MGKTLEWKQRYTTLPAYTEVGREAFWNYSTQSWQDFTPAYAPYTAGVYEDSQRTLSMGHPGPPYREGGPFVMFHNIDGTYVIRHQGVYRDYPRTRRYTGGFCCNLHYPSSLSGLNVETMGEDELTEDWGDPSPYGPTGWSRFAPGQSAADLSIFLGELRDMPRQLKTSARLFRDLWNAGVGRGSTKAMADHWLNHQFGWLPFVNDVRKFIRAAKQADSLYARVVADNGKWKRRGGTIEREEDTDVIQTDNYTGHFPILSSSFYGSGGTGTREISVVTSTYTWFDAAFRYYIPNVRSVKYRRSFMRQLFGLTINPAVLWELCPWSWLIDWFSNVGDNVDNLSHGWADNLVAKYAYVMTTKEQKILIRSTCNLHSGEITAEWESSLTSKRRVGANPFGFSLSWDDYTPRQISILAALGVSRYS